jgi:RNA polymerase-interacting CarD/CdnL/TRCF family regulator
VFSVGETVIKPSVGICKIKGIRRMEIEERTEDYYVIQSGEVDVLVPRKLADAGSLRLPLTQEGVEKIFSALESPFRPFSINSDEDIPPLYKVKPNDMKEKLKRRDPKELVEILRILFNKQQDYMLDKKENDYQETALSMLVEEIAYVEKSQKGRTKARVNKALAAGRKEGKRQAVAEDA